MAERAPWISILRRYLLPRFVMPSSLGRPPVGTCCGTRPSQAAESRPRAKVLTSPIAATSARIQRADAGLPALANLRDECKHAWGKTRFGISFKQVAQARNELGPPLRNDMAALQQALRIWFISAVRSPTS